MPAPSEHAARRDQPTVPAARALNALSGLFTTGAGRWLAVTLLFSGAAIVQTWPLILHATDSIMGWAPDSYVIIVWNLWWVKQAIVELQTNPFHSDFIFYPQGSDLYLHTIIFVNGVLSIPLQLATNNVMLSWNVLSLSFFVLSALGAYALTYRITHNHWSAVLAGYIFAFSPFVMTRMHGHPGISTTWPIPLFALFLARFHDTGRLKEMIALGVVWAVLIYNSFEFAIDAGIFLLLFVAFQTVLHLRKSDAASIGRLWRGTGLATGVWLIISAPLLIPSLLGVLSGDISMRGGLSPPAEFYSADLLAFVTPSPLWGPGKFSEGDFGGQFPTAIGSVEGTVFLGILPLLLAGLAVVLHWNSPQRNTMLLWAGTFLFFAVLALGPFLYVGGSKEFSIGGISFSISLPFRLFDELPVIGLRRAPARMIVVGTLALGVLAGMGLSALMPRLRSGPKAVAPLVTAVALALVILEYWNPPVSLASFTTPGVYEEIAADPGDFAVLDLPVGRITGTVQRGDIIGAAMAQYGQITHEKAIIGGYMSRGKNKDILWLREVPGLKYLSCPICPGFPDSEDLDRELVRRTLRDLDVKYIVFHRVDLEGFPTSYVTDGTADAVESYLASVPGLTPIAVSDEVVAYRNDDVE